MSLLLKIVVFVSIKIVTHQAASISCNDTFLISQNCTCSLTGSKTQIVETMSCNGTYLTNTTQNTLPDLSVTNMPLGVQISNTYTMFPLVPDSYKSLTNLNLEKNQIKSFGNLTNLASLLTFYLGYNSLTQLVPELGCVLINCQRMDFSYNQLETIYFEHFVCYTNTSVLNTTNNYVFSSLQVLLLVGNLIKVKISNLKMFSNNLKKLNLWKDVICNFRFYFLN